MLDETQEDDFAFVYLDVDKLPIAWLAYRGVIASVDTVRTDLSQPSWFLVDTIQRGLSSTLRREGQLEGYRARWHPKRLSRLTSIYAFPTLDAARRSDYGRGKFRRENLVAIRPREVAFRCEEYDMETATNFDALGPAAARDYWQSRAPVHPELLLSGKFSVLGTAVRKRAYEVVRREDPRSLCMLELSRLAAHFGSDLGTITPWLYRGPTGDVLEHVIQYNENEGMRVWRLALEEYRRDPTFQINWADINPLTTSGEDRALDDLFSVGNLSNLVASVRLEKFEELWMALSAGFESADRA